MSLPSSLNLPASHSLVVSNLVHHGMSHKDDRPDSPPVINYLNQRWAAELSVAGYISLSKPFQFVGLCRSES